MRTPHSHAQRFPAGRAARAVTVAALAAAALTATLWSAGADAAAVLCAEAGLLVSAADAGRRGRRRTEAGGASDQSPEFAAEFAGAAGRMAKPSGPAVATRQEAEPSAAFVGIARRIQATVNQELHDLRGMQERHGDTPEVFGDLLRLDHGVSLIGRLADSLAVIGGAGPGRRRAQPVDLLDVVRGALSRIVEYPRVDVEVSGDVAVAGAAVEPVVHALAELLDNATRYSPPDTRVRVGVEDGPGESLVIVVDDAGVGLNAAGYQHARRVLSDPAGAASVGATRLGLTVVGRLARSVGFDVALTRGPSGGTRATLRLPAALLGVPAEAVPAPESVPRPAAPRASSWDPTAVGPTGLPQRRRRAAAPPNNTTPGHATPDHTTPPAAGQWLNAFIGRKDGGRS